MQKSITICLSGGIDSAIAAFLLRKQGYNVKGIYMKNWATPTTNKNDAVPKISKNFDLSCPQHKDYMYAQNVAEFLEIDLKLIDLQKEYWTEVFEPFIEGLGDNITPNPDIYCNRYIKFNALRKHIDTKFMATGHYCRMKKGQLKRARDTWKDQSYFLCQVRNFKDCMFPLGDLLKLQVKWMAFQLANSNVTSFSELMYYSNEKREPYRNTKSTGNIFGDLLMKRESMGICFIGKQDFGTFIDKYMDERTGYLVDIDSGKRIEGHKGSHFYTIGQGIKLSGQPLKLYVVHKDGNTVFVGPYNHVMLYTSSVDVRGMHWFKKPTYSMMAKVRHPFPLISCTYKDDMIYFDTPVRALTPGQVLCLYDDDCVVGSMEIPHDWNRDVVANFIPRSLPAMDTQVGTPH